MDSEFHALDSGFFVSEIWIPDSNRKRDSGFLKLSSRFQSPGFRMPQAKISRGFRNTNPFHGARTSYASWTPGGAGGGGRHSKKVWVELCRRGLQTPTLFKTKIAHFASLFKTGDTTF